MRGGVTRKPAARIRARNVSIEIDGLVIVFRAPQNDTATVNLLHPKNYRITYAIATPLRLVLFGTRCRSSADLAHPCRAIEAIAWVGSPGPSRSCSRRG